MGTGIIKKVLRFIPDILFIRVHLWFYALRIAFRDLARNQHGPRPILHEFLALLAVYSALFKPGTPNPEMTIPQCPL